MAEKLMKYLIRVDLEFEVGARNENQAIEVAEIALYCGVQRYSYGDICVAEIGGAWHYDDPFEDVGIADREGYDAWKREKED
jgi:hypothetical protein